MRTSYTSEQVDAACNAAYLVYTGSLSAQEAIQHLTDDHGINQTSAKDYITIYKQLVTGRSFLRGMASDAMAQFLTHIHENYGSPGISRSLAALQLHIERTEKGNNSTMRSMRSVAEKFERFRSPPDSLDEIQRNFQESVNIALVSTAQARANRLASSDKSPAIIFAITKVFRRNPDVVAEVLVRASGTCEHCNQPAPFRRMKDGTPYLEVHHKKTLATGGSDTVGNAIALCPNCHRKMHYGLN